MAKYKKTSIYEFSDRASLGIYDVPIGALVYVRDNNGTPALVEKISNASLGTGSTIGFFMDDNSSWTLPVPDNTSELVAVVEGLNHGWRINGEITANHGNIGDKSIDMCVSTSASTTRGATGNNSLAIGKNTTASGVSSTSIGIQTQAQGDYSVALGYQSVALGKSSHATCYSSAEGYYSHSEGYNTRSVGYASHSEGKDTSSLGLHSHSEGISCTSNGDNSHAEGFHSNSAGIASHSEGMYTTASNGGGFIPVSVVYATGQTTITMNVGEASTFIPGENLTLESTAGVWTSVNIVSVTGDNIVINGDYSTIDLTKKIFDNYGSGGHAEGTYSHALGNNSHTEGFHTLAYGDNAHAEGQYNIGSPDTIHEVGIGIDEANRANAFEVHRSGAVVAPALTPTLVDLNDQTLVPKSYLLSPEFGLSLPTTNPLVPGTLWNNAGVLSISI